MMPVNAFPLGHGPIPGGADQELNAVIGQARVLPDIAQVLTYLENRFRELATSRDALVVADGATALGICVQLFGGTNLPLSFVDNPIVQAVFKRAFPVGRVPNARQLRVEILNEAKRIRLKINAQTEGSIFCTLLVDGAAAAKRQWLGSIVVTAKGFHFRGLPKIRDSKAETIARHIAAEIKALAEQRLRVIAVITDNASNECAALNPLDAQSVQRQLGQHVLRIPCFSHGTNLAIGDWVNGDLAPKKAFLPEMRSVLNDLRHPHHSNLPAVPSLNPTRWFDLGQVVEYIANHYDAVHTACTPEIQVVLEKYKFLHLLACFRVMESFLRRTESRTARLCDAMGKIHACYDALMLLAMQGNLYAACLGARFLHRMYATQDLAALLLSYLITAKGHAWYQTLPDQGGDSKQRVWQLIEPVISWFEDLLGSSQGLIRLNLKEHLSVPHPHPLQPTVDFWLGVQAAAPTGSYSRPQSRYPLGLMGQILAQLPLSEADVERVFSHMRQLFGDRAQSMGDDLIEARLTIKLDMRDTVPSICEALTDFTNIAQDVARELSNFIKTSPHQVHWGDFGLSQRGKQQYALTQGT
jgi:hypothetical protein